MPAQIVLSSDEAVFGGWENVSKKYDVSYDTRPGTAFHRECPASDNNPHAQAQSSSDQDLPQLHAGPFLRCFL